MIGIIPIGGNATRMNGIPKFLLPIKDSSLLDTLFIHMVNGGALEIAVAMRKEYRPLIYHFPYGKYFSLIVDTQTMSETILLVREHIDTEQTVLFGMPDTYWTDEHVYQRLLGNLDYAIASVAVWKPAQSLRHKRGMCAIKDNRIVQVVDKPQATPLTWGWGAMVWQPAFWPYIKPQDPHVGFALQRAITAGEPIAASKFPGQYFDCGTHAEYYECVAKVMDYA